MAYELFGDVQFEVELNTESSLEPSGDGGIGPVSALPLQYASVTWGTYPYSCKHCGAQGSTMKDLREHAKERHGTCLAWLCADCDTNLENFHHFVEHARGHKEELKQYCAHCGLKLDDSTHSGHAGEVFCGYCGEMNPDFKKYGHQLTYQGSKEIQNAKLRPQRILKYGNEEITCWSNYPYVCSYCNTKYINRWTLRRHLRKIHEKCFGLVCVDCLEEQNTFHQFVEHVRKHRPVLEDNCEYCDTRLADENQYLIHFTTVHKQDYKCNKCGEYFDEESALNMHIIKYIDKPANVVCVNRTREAVSPKVQIACDVCGKVYVSQYHLTLHKTNHVIGRCAYKTIICDYCGKHFAQKTQLIVHIANKHDKNIDGYNCQICNKKFYIESLLHMHVNKIHSANKFECAECHSRFRILKDLKRHLISWHTNTKFYPCDYCSESFKRESCLRKHEIAHTGLKPFYCSECKINFKSIKLYRKHMRSKQRYSHGKSNFCALCNMSYGFPSNYKKHMNAAHNASSFKVILSDKCRSRRKPNFCSICYTDYVSPDNYQNHVAIMHSDKNKPSISNSQSAEASSSATLRSEHILPVIDYSTLPACSSRMDPQVHGIPSLNTLATNAVTQNINIDPTNSNPGTNETNPENIVGAHNIVPAEGTVSNAMNPQEYVLVQQDYFTPQINVVDLNENANAMLLNPSVITQVWDTNSTLVLLGPNMGTLYSSPISIDINTIPTQAIRPTAEEYIRRYMELTSPMMTVMNPVSNNNELLADVNISQDDPNLNNTASEWLTLDPDTNTPPGSDFIFDENTLMPELDDNILLDFDESEIDTATLKFDEVPLENSAPKPIEEFAINPNELSAEVSALIDEAIDDSNSSYSSSIDYCIKKDMSTDLNSNILFGELDNNEPDDE